MSNIVAFTGHRPKGLVEFLGLDPKWTYSDRLRHVLVSVCSRALEHAEADMVISGGALGVDLAAVRAAKDLDIPYKMYLPFKHYNSKWPNKSRQQVFDYCEYAEEVRWVCEPGYDPAKLMKRNEAMVDDCDRLISFWSGRPSGTGNCVKYARNQNVKVLACWKALEDAVAKASW